MTLHELSQLYWLNLEIERLGRKLKELRASAGLKAAPLESSGAHGSTNSRTEDMALRIVELEAKMEKRKHEAMEERMKLESYIDSIDDVMTRLIFQYRFIDGLRWEDVASQVGGKNTANSVRMTCYRYLGMK